MTSRRSYPVVSLVCTACAASPPPPSAGSGVAVGVTDPAPAPHDHAPASSMSEKPTAPVELAIGARPVPGASAVERFEILLTATPTPTVGRVVMAEMAIDGRPVAPDAAREGTNQVRATVEVPRGTGRSVVGTAAVLVDGKRVGRAVEICRSPPAA